MMDIENSDGLNAGDLGVMVAYATQRDASRKVVVVLPGVDLFRVVRVRLIAGVLTLDVGPEKKSIGAFHE